MSEVRSKIWRVKKESVNELAVQRVEIGMIKYMCRVNVMSWESLEIDDVITVVQWIRLRFTHDNLEWGYRKRLPELATKQRKMLWIAGSGEGQLKMLYYNHKDRVWVK